MQVAQAQEMFSVFRARAGHALREAGLRQLERVFCGAVQAGGAPSEMRALVSAAEEALLQARESADGMAVLKPAAPSGDAARALQDDALATVREALQARRLTVVGQVAYRMSDHRALHTEIMARLRDASGREMAAAEFMPVVAAHGLGEQLDRSVIETVIQAMRGREGMLSLNVSMRSVERPAFVEWLGKLLEREKALAPRLAFEVPEHGVVQNEAAATAFARAVSQRGAGFAIDHFGLHRDSLALIQRLRPAYIKLAAAHTPGLVSDGGARFFAESLVRAARQLDVPVIVLNVEDDETFQSIGSIGFSGYQGNLAGRPSPWP
jgi:EAL domain-containing protein (putative c-di-GMP-specific phosphodiesterase class I)